MAYTYGDPNSHCKARAMARDGIMEIYTVRFTTANTSAPTVDTVNTKGVISVARTSAGLFTITLPHTAQSIVATASQGPSSAQIVTVQNPAAGGTTLTVTVVTAGGSTAVDTTGMIVSLVIFAAVRG
jgi:hypothetical protein